MSEPVRFAILVSAFHAEAYIERCLRSALMQDYPHFRLFFIDDFSADGTGTRGRAEIARYPHRCDVMHWTSTGRQGILANQIKMIEQCREDEVMVCLDGDDQLAHPSVLSLLAKVYADPDVWCTYGSYEYDHESRNPNGNARGISQQIPPDHHTRHAGWCSSHLKTFYAWLARCICPEDLKFRGEWIDAAPDLALMFPLIEMAGPEHARYIEQVLYYYNGRNPLNETKIKPAWVRVMTDELLRRPVYSRLVRKPG